MFTNDGGAAAITTATNTGATTAAPAAGTTTATQTVKSTSDWTSSYNDENKGYIQAKNFKDPNEVLNSYRMLEKTVGAGLDKIIKLPSTTDAPEWNDIYTKLGKPMEAKNYKIPVPEGQQEDKATNDKIREIFHEANLTSEQGEKIAAKWQEMAMGKMKEASEAQLAANKVAEGDLKTEWGKAFDQNVETAKKAAKAFGLDGDTIEKMEKAMGFPPLMKFLKEVGSKIAVEGSFIDGGGPKAGGFNGAMEPAHAQAQIKEKMSDPEFIRRVSSGDSRALGEWNKLHEYAYPGTRESSYNGPQGRK